MSRRGPMNMAIFEGIMDAEFFTTELLENNVLPFIRRILPDSHRFVQDNGRAREGTNEQAKTFWTLRFRKKMTDGKHLICTFVVIINFLFCCTMISAASISVTVSTDDLQIYLRR